MSWLEDNYPENVDAMRRQAERKKAARVSAAIARAEEELRSAGEERNRLYWAFTRQAKAPPVPSAVTRRYYAAIDALAAAKATR